MAEKFPLQFPFVFVLLFSKQTHSGFSDIHPPVKLCWETGSFGFRGVARLNPAVGPLRPGKRNPNQNAKTLRPIGKRVLLVSVALLARIRQSVHSAPERGSPTGLQKTSNICKSSSRQNAECEFVDEMRDIIRSAILRESLSVPHKIENVDVKNLRSSFRISEQR
jgi:hypothetical protein